MLMGRNNLVANWDDCIFVSTTKQNYRRPASQGKIFLCMFPIIVTRSIMKINENNLSVVFIARFSNDSEKMLRQICKITAYTKICEIGTEEVLSNKECTLYYRDWTKTPTLGSFETDYPE